MCPYAPPSVKTDSNTDGVLIFLQPPPGVLNILAGIGKVEPTDNCFSYPLSAYIIRVMNLILLTGMKVLV
jgi:hypothetical protein